MSSLLKIGGAASYAQEVAVALGLKLQDLVFAPSLLEHLRDGLVVKLQGIVLADHRRHLRERRLRAVGALCARRREVALDRRFLSCSSRYGRGRRVARRGRSRRPRCARDPRKRQYAARRARLLALTDNARCLSTPLGSAHDRTTEFGLIRPFAASLTTSPAKVIHPGLPGKASPTCRALFI
jgi:hypothetical protein